MLVHWLKELKKNQCHFQLHHTTKWYGICLHLTRIRDTIRIRTLANPHAPKHVLKIITKFGTGQNVKEKIDTIVDTIFFESCNNTSKTLF